MLTKRSDRDQNKIAILQAVAEGDKCFKELLESGLVKSRSTLYSIIRELEKENLIIGYDTPKDRKRDDPKKKYRISMKAYSHESIKNKVFVNFMMDSIKKKLESPAWNKRIEEDSAFIEDELFNKLGAMVFFSCLLEMKNGKAMPELYLSMGENLRWIAEKSFFGKKWDSLLEIDILSDIHKKYRLLEFTEISLPDFLIASKEDVKKILREKLTGVYLFALKEQMAKENLDFSLIRFEDMAIFEFKSLGEPYYSFAYQILMDREENRKLHMEAKTEAILAMR